MVGELEIDPSELGLSARLPQRWRGATRSSNPAIALSVLGGEPGPARDVTLLNAGAALFVAGRAADVRRGDRHGGGVDRLGERRGRRDRGGEGGSVTRSVLDELLDASRERARRDARSCR